MMFLRSAPTDTVSTLMNALDERTEALSLNAADIRISAEDDVIALGEREVPYNEDGLIAVGNWLNVPTAFLKRMDTDLQQHMLNAMLHRRPEPIVAKVGHTGLRLVKEPNTKEVEPRRMVEIASRVLGENAPVIDWSNDLDNFRFDAVVPEGATFGIGGDATATVADGKGGRRVGDITRGGLRFDVDLRRNLAPSVQPYTYRLVCTNGMEMFDAGLKVDARGGTVEEVLAELEEAAERAFSRVERDIAHFYELRNERVDNPERHLSRMARERRLSDRMTVRLIQRLPGVVDEDGRSTMFDLMNLITNAANDPNVTRWGARRELETFGGHILTSSVSRCGVCSSAL